ncbi:MAG: small, acid-soluble spore protein, alpha/beta type [Oscillospiraceae bacterium]|nr:small, acid-soluble spore protein, alpha/beta type [Oscillospiraceae bacterium]
MSNNNSSNNSNRINVPEAREGMNQFKMQAANDLDVSFTY